MLLAQRIKIKELGIALDKLQRGVTEYDFIGITSNGVDCLYFHCENGKFNVSFEAMTALKRPFIDRLKKFSEENDYPYCMTNYKNKKGWFKPIQLVPVIHLQAKLNFADVAVLGLKIQQEIFNNNADTVYDLVP